MQLLKKVLSIHHLIAVCISLCIFAIFSLILSTPMNKLINDLLLQSEIGANFITTDTSITTKLVLPFLDIFLLLQSTTFNFLLSNGNYEYGGELHLGFTIILFICSLPFIISGLYLGIKKRSENSIPTFTILYTTIILILTLLYENKLTHSNIQLNLHYTIDIIALLCISSISTYIGLQIHQMFSKKNNLATTINLVVKAVATNLLLYFTITSVFIIGAFGMIKERLIYMFPSLPITEWFHLSVQLIATISSQVSAYLLGLVHLLPVSISIHEDATVNDATFSIAEGITLNGDVSIGTYSLFIVRDLLNKVPYDEYLIYLLIIPAFILVFIGYRAKIEHFSWKQTISFSLFYALFVTFVVSMSTIQWDYTNATTNFLYSITLSFDHFKLLISSLTFALFGFSLGHFIKRLKTKKQTNTSLKQ